MDDVREAFHDARGFLITSMLECQEGLDWAQTPMLNYYESKFPVSQIRAQSVHDLTLLQEEYSGIETRVFGNSNVSKTALSENGDGSKKRKSQSPHTEEPKEKKTRKGKATAQVGRSLPETPLSRRVLDLVSSDEDGIPNVLTRKRKSILQPSGGKTARKAAGRRKSLLAVDGPTEGSHEEDENEESHSSEQSPIIAIRTAEELELLTNPPGEGSRDDAHGLKYLPRKYLELRVVEYDLPSTEPQGPGDLWTCTFESCFHRVHGASKPEGKARVSEHFKTHATQAQEKINLALNESRPYLPVK